MAYLVEKRFVHRDLASRNCLLHQNNQTKVSDFGLSRPFDEGEDHYVMREGARLSMKWTDPGSVVDKLFGGEFGATVCSLLFVSLGCFYNCCCLVFVPLLELSHHCRR